MQSERAVAQFHLSPSSSIVPSCRLHTLVEYLGGLLRCRPATVLTICVELRRRKGIGLEQERGAHPCVALDRQGCGPQGDYNKFLQGVRVTCDAVEAHGERNRRCCCFRSPLSRNARITSLSFERSVFGNCRFDNDYLPILQATVFAIHDCEFVARSVVEATKQHELRIDARRRMDRSPRKLEAADDGGGTTQPLECATRVK